MHTHIFTPWDNFEPPIHLLVCFCDVEGHRREREDVHTDSNLSKGWNRESGSRDVPSHYLQHQYDAAHVPLGRTGFE